MLYKWSEDLSVGVKEIDDQHKLFLDLCNKAYDYVVNRRPEGVLSSVLMDIRSYALMHFRTEERYFDLFDYALKDEHKKEHAELLSKLDVFIEEQTSLDIYQAAFDLLDFLEDWLVQHLKRVDHKYVQCFHDHGLK